MKKAVKDQVKEIVVTSKSYDDWSRSIVRVATKLCVVSKGGQRRRIGGMSK